MVLVSGGDAIAVLDVARLAKSIIARISSVIYAGTRYHGEASSRMIVIVDGLRIRGRIGNTCNLSKRIL
jgi:hypothetical protein